MRNLTCKTGFVFLLNWCKISCKKVITRKNTKLLRKRIYNSRKPWFPAKRNFTFFCENFLYATILLYFRISFTREKYENFHFSLRSVSRKNSCISRNVSFAGNPSGNLTFSSDRNILNRNLIRTVVFLPIGKVFISLTFSKLL